MLSNLSQVLWRLNRAPKKITDEQRDAALKATTELLAAIDIKRVDELRRKFELPPECLGFVAEIYATLLAAPCGESRDVLPLSSGVDLKATERVTLKGEPKAPFRPERLVVSNAGTAGGAADWVVNDIRLDGKTIFLQQGDIPGDMFAANAIDTFVSWGECKKVMEIDVTYIGITEKGCPFFGAAVGSRLVPPDESAREPA